MVEVLDMQNTNALITAAMLAAIYENHRMDYLDLIQPFVCTLLPSRNQYINFMDVQHRMESDYGFVRMPIGVLHKIAEKLTKTSPPICEVRQRNNYIVCNTYDNSDFRTKRNNIKVDCNAVAESLKSYFYTERAITLELDECTNAFLKFLDHCGHNVLKTEDSLRALQSEEKINRYIATYIQTEKEKQSVVYDKILEIARGYMVYRCIYFYCQTEEGYGNFSLRNVKIYLDTPLILNLLGFDTLLGKQAVLDAVDLARSLGATVSVLEHNVEEVQGILNAYVASYPRVQSFSLQSITLNGFSEVTIRSLADQIPSRIVEILGEDIEIAPGLGTSSDWDRINTEEALRRYYYQSIQKKGNDTVRTTRIENDVRTLSFALQMRNGDRPREFEKCKVIVLSDSKTARNATRALYDDYCHDEINIVYSLNDFSCMAWLASPSPTSSVPEILLLYNAAAALTPSDAVIERMLKYVDELAEVGAIGQDVAYLLRTHPTVKEATAEVVSNDVDSLTPDMLTEIYEKAVAKKAEQVIGETITPQLIRLKQQAENNKERAIAAEEELNKQQYKDTMRIRNLESMAQAKSDKVVKCISKAGLNLLLAVRVFIVGYFLFSLIKGLSHDLWSNINAFTIGNALLAVLCAIDYFVPKMHWGDRWIKKFANWCGDCIYKREINKGKKYLEMK